VPPTDDEVRQALTEAVTTLNRVLPLRPVLTATERADRMALRVAVLPVVFRALLGQA
jgi:hypothetical protein